jgi:hypothetical protein
VDIAHILGGSVGRKPFFFFSFFGASTIKCFDSSLRFLGLTAGIVDGEHHRRLGAAWMLFAWCVLRQTGQGQEGIVCRGDVLTYEGIASEMNCRKGSVREWMRRLVDQGYIRTERDRRGIRIFVLNPKKFRAWRVWKSQHPKPPESVGTSARRVSKCQQSKEAHPTDSKSTSRNVLQNNLTKHLMNNNTTAAPKNGADHLFFLLGKEKCIPTETPSQAQIAKREKLLARQRLEILSNPRYSNREAAISA